MTRQEWLDMVESSIVRVRETRDEYERQRLSSLQKERAELLAYDRSLRSSLEES